MITINNINYYTTKEAADKLQMSLRCFQLKVSSGKILPFRCGPKKLYFTEEILEKYIKGE